MIDVFDIALEATELRHQMAEDLAREEAWMNMLFAEWDRGYNDALQGNPPDNKEYPYCSGYEDGEKVRGISLHTEF